MDNYEQKYNAALERAKEYHDNGGAPLILEVIFPELKGSEDGKNKRISKEITQFLKQNNGWNREWLAWLEKQGHMLDPDKVIEWLNDQACQGWIEDVEVDKFVDKFKDDFGL